MVGFTLNITEGTNYNNWKLKWRWEAPLGKSSLGKRGKPTMGISKVKTPLDFEFFVPRILIFKMAFGSALHV